MDSDRLARYLAGEASSEDRAAVQEWAAADSARAAELAQLGAVFDAARPSSDWDVDRAWGAVSGRIDAGELIAPTPWPAWRLPALGAWLAAAGAVLAVGLGAWWVGRARLTVHQTGIGQRETITLADGTRVTLAPATRLAFRPDFGRDKRELELEGRAWFEVTHDATRPFRVLAAGTWVEDLGTEFEIVAAPRTTELQVAVMSGSVVLKPTKRSTQPTTLGPRDVATVSAGGVSRVTHAAPVERLVSWRLGTLAFEDRPLGEVLSELERWYDVTFDAAATLVGRRFTGDLPTSNLRQALEVITTALAPVTTSTSGRTVTLAPGSPP